MLNKILLLILICFGLSLANDTLLYSNGLPKTYLISNVDTSYSYFSWGLPSTYGFLYNPSIADPFTLSIRHWNDNNDKDTAEIGQLWVFDGAGTQYTLEDTLTRSAQYRWDFGDGYKVDSLFPSTDWDQQGMAVAHYFMDTGTFIVKMTVSLYDSFQTSGLPVYSTLIDKDSTYDTVYITGVPVADSFYVRHAPFHARKSQWMYVHPKADWLNQGYNLNTYLFTSESDSTLLQNEANITNVEYRYLFDQSLLNSGTYWFKTRVYNGSELLDSALWKETFVKRIDGVPSVSIDYNNAFWADDSLIFPFGNFLTDASVISARKDSGNLNMMYSEGYVAEHSSATYSEWVSQCKNNGVYAWGPGHPAGDGYEKYLNYWVDGTKYTTRHRFNISIDSIVDYVNASKDSSNIIGWNWFDEPNLGSRYAKTYLPTLLAWQYMVERNDGNHPNYNSNTYNEWTNNNNMGNKYRIYDYDYSPEFMGGKHACEDVFGGDAYNYGYRGTVDFNSDTMGPLNLWMTAIDRINNNRTNIVPFIQVQENAYLNGGYDTISSQETKMMLWLSVIYGNAKGAIIFPYWNPPYHWEPCRDFIDTVNLYKDLILGDTTTITVSDNSNSKLNRVESMVRQNNDTVYVFSVRATEPDTIEGETILYKGVEPDSIFTTFVVSGQSGENTVSSSTGKTLTAIDGVFTDTLLKNDFILYKIYTPFAPAITTDLTSPVTCSLGVQCTLFVAHDGDSIQWQIYKSGAWSDTVSNYDTLFRTNYYADRNDSARAILMYGGIPVDTSTAAGFNLLWDDVAISAIVSPSSASCDTGKTVQFSAAFYDLTGNTTENHDAIVWSTDATGPTEGSIDAGTGLFTAGTAYGGPYVVTATAGAVTDNAEVTVVAPSGVTNRSNWSSWSWRNRWLRW